MTSKIGDAVVILAYVALATTLVLHNNTASDINAVGNVWTSATKASITG